MIAAVSRDFVVKDEGSEAAVDVAEDAVAAADAAAATAGADDEDGDVAAAATTAALAAAWRMEETPL